MFRAFTEQEMDGNAIAFGLASAPGPDWLKELVPTLGQRLKVHNALRTLCSECQVSYLKCAAVQVCACSPCVLIDSSN